MYRRFLTLLLICLTLFSFQETQAENKAYSQKKFLLITGCGRSGTGYISCLLRKCGLDIGHEYFGKDGCSSWTMAVDDPYSPWGPSAVGTHFEHVIHQVRNPLDQIRSFYNVEPYVSWAFIRKHVPEIKTSDNHLTKCAKYWYYWNILADQKSEYTYRVEDIDHILDDLSKFLGVELDQSAILKVSKKYNSRPHSLSGFTWKTLEENIPDTLLNNIRQLAKSYGYKDEELRDHL